MASLAMFLIRARKCSGDLKVACAALLTRSSVARTDNDSTNARTSSICSVLIGSVQESANGAVARWAHSATHVTASILLPCSRLYGTDSLSLSLSLSGCRSSEYSSSLLTALPRAATARAEPAQELIHDGDWLSTQAARSMPAIEPASNVPVIPDRLSIVER